MSMLQLISPKEKVAAAQWEYDAENTDLIEDLAAHKLQYLLAVETTHQHGQILTAAQVQEIKTRCAEVRAELEAAPLREETLNPHFIIGSGTLEDPYKMNYSSFLLTEA